MNSVIEDQKMRKSIQHCLLYIVLAGAAAGVQALTISDQGSYSSESVVVGNSKDYQADNPKQENQTLHADFASVFYQIPENRKKNAIVFQHGAGQSARCWMTTPDGRDGYQNLYLKKGYAVHLVDQPRRGQAGTSSQELLLKPNRVDQFVFGQFRFGMWPNWYPDSQFAGKNTNLDVFYRQATPDTGPRDSSISGKELAQVTQKAGPSILFTHSAGGVVGWKAVLNDNKIVGIVAFEPGYGFIFPESSSQRIIKTNSHFGQNEPIKVPEEQFKKFTKVPILILYGDNVPSEPSTNKHLDYWRSSWQMAKNFAAEVNKQGGNVTVVRLPDIGIKGNTHFIFSDANNVEVADYIDSWLKKNKLDD